MSCTLNTITHHFADDITLFVISIVSGLIFCKLPLLRYWHPLLSWSCPSQVLPPFSSVTSF